MIHRNFAWSNTSVTADNQQRFLLTNAGDHLFNVRFLIKETEHKYNIWKSEKGSGCIQNHQQNNNNKLIMQNTYILQTAFHGGWQFKPLNKSVFAYLLSWFKKIKNYWRNNDTYLIIGENRNHLHFAKLNPYNCNTIHTCEVNFCAYWGYFPHLGKINMSSYCVGGFK